MLLVWPGSLPFRQLLQVAKDSLAHHYLLTGFLTLKQDLLDQLSGELCPCDRLVTLCQLAIAGARLVLEEVEVENPPGALGGVL